MPQGPDEIVDSVVLITGTNSGSFGTGFVFRSQDGEIWILTCAHVVRNVGGPGKVRVDDERVMEELATVVACGEEDEADVAVLRARARRGRQIPALKLGLVGMKGLSCHISGYADLTAPFRRAETIEGTLGSTAVLQAPGGPRIKAWKLWIEGSPPLEAGYSGSPVACAATRTVFAVASHSEYQGERGYAVSLASLQDVWPAMPPELLDPRSETDSQLDGEVGGVTAPMPEKRFVTSYPPDTLGVRRAALQSNLDSLLRDYEATIRQSANVLAAADRGRLERQAADLWAQIEVLEQGLKASG